MATIHEKPLKIPNQNNPQIREYIDAIERGKDALHIFPSEDGWKLKKIGGDDLGFFDTQKEAVSQAYDFAQNGSIAISAIITHDENGLISERSDDFPAQSGSHGPRNWFGSWFK